MDSKEKILNTSPEEMMDKAIAFAEKTDDNQPIDELVQEDPYEPQTVAEQMDDDSDNVPVEWATNE